MRPFSLLIIFGILFSICFSICSCRTDFSTVPNDGKLVLADAYARWCASRDNTIGAHVRSDFRITSPPPNAHYQIDPILSPSQQMVELTAACASDVEWFVNGERLTPERDGRVFWQLAAGEWNVRAVSAGKLAEAKFVVEDISN